MKPTTVASILAVFLSPLPALLPRRSTAGRRPTGDGVEDRQREDAVARSRKRQAAPAAEPEPRGPVMSSAAVLELLSSRQYLWSSAGEKRMALWNLVLRHRYRELPRIRFSFLWSVLRGAFIFNLRRPFVTVADGRPPRLKLFHPWGTAARVRFVADGDHPYTGLFACGGQGLVRLSLAMDERRYSPGGAFKLLVDGGPSRNLSVVPGLDPFDHRDFFAPPLTNVLARPTRPPFSVGWFLTYFWMSHVAHPVVQSLAKLSQVTADGRTVTRWRAPHQVILRAPEELSFHPQTETDFRQELAAAVPPGTLLYRLYGRDEGEGSRPVYVGKFVTESPFVASSFVDRILAFEHVRETPSKFEWRLRSLLLLILALLALVIAVVLIA